MRHTVLTNLYLTRSQGQTSREIQTGREQGEDKLTKSRESSRDWKSDMAVCGLSTGENTESRILTGD